ncbi:MAG: protein kinase, partial [Myxococcota bacterium]|nr:protein kinase [Myxococcota bacterium]
MIGETIGNFRVIRRLGQGGMGEVLLGEHKDIQTKVAIKMLLPHISSDKQHVQRFFNEAVAVSKIKHAGIARIFDVGFHAQIHAYLVMEYLEGESLASRISRSGRLPFEQVSDIAKQIASVLEATHTEGITHRDLKPDNIFLVPDSELSSGERVKILDFGIAKLNASGMTQDGGAMGTPAYMSPEQWKNTSKVDGRADIYSLGCLVFEMACGRPPFVADSIGELCVLHLGETPPRARSIVPELPAAFDELVARLLAKSAEERPTLREAKAAFTQWANDFRGVAAPTMLPDGLMPTMAPGSIPPRWDTPAAPRVAAAQTPRPTTLGGSAMAVTTPPPPARSKLPLLGGVGVLAIAGVVAAFALRGGGDREA